MTARSGVDTISEQMENCVKTDKLVFYPLAHSTIAIEEEYGVRLRTSYKHIVLDIFVQNVI